MLDRRTITYLVFVAATIFANASLRAQARALVITRVNVFDVVNRRIVHDRTVTISGGIIASIKPNTAPPSDARVVDGRGKFLIPGLWDMHAHMEMTGESWLQLYAANGVTSIRDMGSDLDFILKLREATSSG